MHTHKPTAYTPSHHPPEGFGLPILRRTPARWKRRWDPYPPSGSTTRTGPQHTFHLTLHRKASAHLSREEHLPGGNADSTRAIHQATHTGPQHTLQLTTHTQHSTHTSARMPPAASLLLQSRPPYYTLVPLLNSHPQIPHCTHTPLLHAHPYCTHVPMLHTRCKHVPCYTHAPCCTHVPLRHTHLLLYTHLTSTRTSLRLARPLLHARPLLKLHAILALHARPPAVRTFH